MEEGQTVLKCEEIREFSVRLHVLVMSEAGPLKSHQHDCPNMWWTRMKLKDILTQMVKRPGGLNAVQRTARNWVNLEAKEVSIPGEEHTSCYPVLNGQPWKVMYK